MGLIGKLAFRLHQIKLSKNMSTDFSLFSDAPMRAIVLGLNSKFSDAVLMNFTILYTVYANIRKSLSKESKN